MTGTAFAFLMAIVSPVLAVFLALRQERVTRQRDLESLLQEHVSSKLDGILEAIAAHEKRISEAERKHERLLGRLEGKGIFHEAS